MELDKCKLYIQGFELSQKNSEIREICLTYGKFARMYRPEGKTYVFLVYDTEEQAEEAKMKFDQKGHRCNFAYKSGNAAKNMSPNGDNSPKFFNSPKVSSIPKKFTDNNGANESNRLKRLPQVGEKIFITHVDGSHVYGILAAYRKEYEGAFRAVVATAGKNGDQLKHPIKQHTWAFALHNHEYVRVIITKTMNKNDEYVSVFLCDIGLHKEVSFEQLKEIPICLHGNPWANRYQLNNVSDRLLRGAVKYLEMFVKKEVEVASIYTNRNNQIELIDPETSQNINKMITVFNDELKVGHLTMRLPKCGVDKTLCVVNMDSLNEGENLITFIQHADQITYQEQQAQIQKHGVEADAMPKYFAETDDLCMVNIGEKWQRGVFIEYVQQYGSKVYFIDICRTEYVDTDRIRKIPRKIADMPMMAFAAKMAGYTRSDIGLCESTNEIIKIIQRSDIITAKVLHGPSDDDFIYTVEL